MSKTTIGIIIVIVIAFLGIWAYFWQMGRKATEEARTRAEALKTEMEMPASPSEAPPSGTLEPGANTEEGESGAGATSPEGG